MAEPINPRQQENGFLQTWQKMQEARRERDQIDPMDIYMQKLKIDKLKSGLLEDTPEVFHQKTLEFYDKAFGDNFDMKALEGMNPKQIRQVFADYMRYQSNQMKSERIIASEEVHLKNANAAVESARTYRPARVAYLKEEVARIAAYIKAMKYRAGISSGENPENDPQKLKEEIDPRFD